MNKTKRNLKLTDFWLRSLEFVLKKDASVEGELEFTVLSEVVR